VYRVPDWLIWMRAEGAEGAEGAAYPCARSAALGAAAAPFASDLLAAPPPEVLAVMELASRVI
jgi:hypothetical protein